MKMLKSLSWQPVFWLTAIFAGYFLISMQHLELPGPDDNEMWFPAHAKAFLKGELQPGILEFRKQYIPLWGHPLPLVMGGPTPHGPLRVYALIPVILSFGANIYTYRLTSIFLGALVLLFTYLFCRRFIGHEVGALAATLLLATDPTFLFFMRSDPSEVTPIMVSMMAGMFFVARWYQNGESRYLYLGTFFFGLGLLSRLHFVWFLLAASISVLVIYKENLKSFIKTRRRQLILATISFLVGCSPLVIYVIATRASPARELASVFEHTDAQVDNRLVLQNLTNQTSHFLDLLSGARLLKNFTMLPDRSGFAARVDLINTLIPVLFVVSIVYALYSGIRKNELSRWKKILFLTLIIALILGQSIFTVSDFHSYNLVILWPLPHIVVALAIADIYQFSTTKSRDVTSRKRSWIPLAVLVLATLVNLNAVRNFYNELQRVGSTLRTSDAMYDLAVWIDQHAQGKRVILMDWGIGKNLYALTHVNAQFEDAWPNLLYDAELGELLDQESNLYVFRSEQDSMVKYWLGRDGPRIAFQMALQEKGYVAQLEEKIYQRSGDVAFEIYSLRRKQ